MTRVTVVNDNPEFLGLMGDILTDERYTVTLIDGDDGDAVDRVRRSAPDVLIVDLRMGTDQLHGWEIAKQVREHRSFRDLPTLLCSADVQGLGDLELEIGDVPRTRTLSKPFALEQLTEVIDALLADSASA